MRWQAIQPPRPSTSGSPVNQSCDTATIAGVTPKFGLFAARQPTNPASWERSVRKYVPSTAVTAAAKSVRSIAARRPRRATSSSASGTPQAATGYLPSTANA